mmetsp:Transcript_32499/g.30973  ORF Transcript_32499/g.30973 Transcript_32499/m.30973 type:complete len:142 (+) Transcript_32499:103-528(+)
MADMHGSLYIHQETIEIVNFASNLIFISDDKVFSIAQVDKYSTQSNYKRYLIWNRDVTSYKNEQTRRKIGKIMSNKDVFDKIVYVPLDNIEIADPNMKYENRDIDILEAFGIGRDGITVHDAEKYHDSHTCVNISIRNTSS